MEVNLHEDDLREIALRGYEGAASSDRTRYTVTPTPMQNWLATNLPKRVVDRMVGGRLGLLPKKR